MRMGWLRKSEELAGRADPLASWGERIAKALWWVLGGPVVSGLVLGAIGWISHNLLYGALIGLAAWALTQVGFTVWGFRRLALATSPPRSSEPQALDGGDSTH